MKKIKLVVLLLAIVSMGLYAQEKEEGKVVLKKVGTEAVPGVVVSAVEEDYPDATVTAYSMIPVTMYEDQWAVTDVEDNRKKGDEIDHYVVQLTGNNVNGQAVYSADGDLLQFKAKITNEKLPKPVMKFIEKYYPDWGITDDKETIKLTNKKAVDYFKVKLTKGNKSKVLVMTPEGKVIREH